MAFKPLFLREFRPISVASWSLNDDSLLSVGTNLDPETEVESFKVTFAEFKLYLENLNFVSLTIGSTDLTNRSDGLVSGGNTTILKDDSTHIMITVDQNIYDPSSALTLFNTISYSTIISDDSSNTELLLSTYLDTANWYRALFTVVSGNTNAFAPNSYFHIKDKDVFILGSDDIDIKGLMLGSSAKQTISLEGSLSIGTNLISLEDNFFSKTLQVGKDEAKATSIDFYTNNFNTTYDNATFFGTTEFGTVSTDIDTFKIYSQNVSIFSPLYIESTQYLSIDGYTKLKKYTLDLKESGSGDAGYIKYLPKNENRYDPNGGIKCYIRDQGDAGYKWFCIKREDVPEDDTESLKYAYSLSSSYIQGYDGTPTPFQLDQWLKNDGTTEVTGLGTCYVYRILWNAPVVGLDFYFKKNQSEGIQTNYETNIGTIILGENFLANTEVRGSLFVDNNTMLNGNLILRGGSVTFDGIATTISDGELTFSDVVNFDENIIVNNNVEFNDEVTFNKKVSFTSILSADKIDFAGDVGITGAFRADGSVVITGQTDCIDLWTSGIFTANGNSRFYGHVEIQHDCIIGTTLIPRELIVFGTTDIKGICSLNGKLITYDTVENKESVETHGDNTIHGDTTIDQNLFVHTDTYLYDNLHITGDDTEGIIFDKNTDPTSSPQLNISETQSSFIATPSATYENYSYPRQFPDYADTYGNDNLEEYDSATGYFTLVHEGIYLINMGGVFSTSAPMNISNLVIYIEPFISPTSTIELARLTAATFTAAGVPFSLNGSVVIRTTAENEKYRGLVGCTATSEIIIVHGQTGGVNRGTFLSCHRLG